MVAAKRPHTSSSSSSVVPTTSPSNKKKQSQMLNPLLSPTSESQQADLIEAAPKPTASATSEATDAAPVAGWLPTVVAPLIAGMAFGAVFVLSRVHEFYFIREQMLMRHFLMLKMFLSAAATSTLVLTLLPYVSIVAQRRINHWRRVMSVIVGEHRGLPIMLLGGGLIGTGMALCGSCPGTVFAQLASGSVQARWIFLGCMIAAIGYPLLELIPGWIEGLKRGRIALQGARLDQLFGARSFGAVALPMIAAFIAIVSVCEYFSPWHRELIDLLPEKSAHFPYAIPPFVAGIVVGLLQVPLILLVNNHLGTSSAYVTMVANGVCAFSAGACDRVPLYKSTRAGYWQVMLVIGITVGGIIASQSTGATFESDHLVSTPRAIIGGILLVVGSRLAAGCTSGHGISGMGHLAVNSFFAVAAMFGAGIGVSFALYGR